MQAELDRFCDAMIAIRQEIKQIETGAANKDNNVLKVRRCRIRSSHGSCRLRLAVLQLTLALLSTACAASGKRCAGGQVGPAILSRDDCVPRVLGAPVQVLADNRSRRQCVW